MKSTSCNLDKWDECYSSYHRLVYQDDMVKSNDNKYLIGRNSQKSTEMKSRNYMEFQEKSLVTKVHNLYQNSWKNS